MSRDRFLSGLRRLFPSLLPGVLLLAGCGYHVVHPDEAFHLLAGRSLAIPLAANNSYRANIEGTFTDALIGELQSRGAARLVPPGQADLLLAATISSYGYIPFAFSSNDQVVNNVASLAVAAAITERTTGKVLWRGNLQSSQDFPAYVDLALQQNSEQAAIVELCRRLARDLLTRLGEEF